MNGYTDYLKSQGFNDPYKPHPLVSFSGLKHKSIWRAMRREKVSIEGEAWPNKPFNNRGNSSKRKNTHSRAMNEEKKKVYVELKKLAV